MSTRSDPAEHGAPRLPEVGVDCSACLSCGMAVLLVKPGAHELPRQRCRSVAAGGARQERPGTTCAHKFRAHLTARSRETNICRVEYFSAGASKGAPRLRRVRGSAGVL